MKQLQGLPLNLRQTTVQKVVLRERLPEIGSYNYYLSGGSILSPSMPDKTALANRQKGIFHIKALPELNLGDILLIESKGNASIVFEEGSQANVLFINSKCNCNCIMCPQVETSDTDCNKLNRQIIGLINKDTKFLALTGGEPTCDFGHLIDCLRRTAQALPSTQIELLTNGVLLEDIELARAIQNAHPRNLCFDIPVHADVDSIHNVMAGSRTFYKVLTGLLNLARLSQRIEIRIVVTALNYQRLPSISEFVCRNLPFVEHVAIMGLELEGEAKRNADLLWIDPREYGDILLDTIERLHSSEVSVSIYNHQLCGLPTKLWSFSKKSISPWKNTFLKGCSGCLNRNRCGGFFSSTVTKGENWIKPIKERKEECVI